MLYVFLCFFRFLVVFIVQIFLTNKAQGSICTALDSAFEEFNNGRIRNSYTMCCPPVRGDNPRALASGLSYVQVDKHGITIVYHLHQCRPCTSRDTSC